MNDSNLESKVESLTNRLTKIEEYFKVAKIVLGIFGIGGAFGYYIFDNLSKEIKQANNDIDELNKKIPDAKKEIGKLKYAVDFKQRESIENIDLKTKENIAQLGSKADLAIKTALQNNKINVKKWPAGNYCIISNSKTCPDGFSKSHGYLRAISIYPKGNRNSYIKETPAGGIDIKCHGNCTKTNDHWIGEIHITTCCK